MHLGIILSIAGGTLGLGAALATTRFMPNMLCNVPPDDPGTLRCGLGSFAYGHLGRLQRTGAASLTNGTTCFSAE